MTIATLTSPPATVTVPAGAYTALDLEQQLQAVTGHAVELLHFGEVTIPAGVTTAGAVFVVHPTTRTRSIALDGYARQRGWTVTR